jgi:hypothetical protein
VLTKTKVTSDRVLAEEVGNAIASVPDLLVSCEVVVDDGEVQITLHVPRTTVGLGAFELAEAVLEVVNVGQVRRLAAQYDVDADSLLAFLQRVSALNKVQP